MGSAPIVVVDLKAPYLQRKTTSRKESISQTWTILHFNSVSAVDDLSSCTASRDVKLGSCLHAKVVKSGLDANVFVNNALLDMYVKNGSMVDARKLFDLMPERTVVTWTSMVSGYSRNGLGRDAMLTFLEMMENQIIPNEFTLAAVLQACSQGSDRVLARAVHGYVAKSGFMSDEFLQNTLVGVYAKCGVVDTALKILRGFGLKNVVAWSSVVSGCVLNGMVEEAISLFSTMKQEGIEPNDVTLLSILHACSLLRQEMLFRWAHGLVLAPETMASLLQGCANSAFAKLGEPLHGYL